MMVPLTAMSADFSLERFQLVFSDVEVSMFQRTYGITRVDLDEGVTTMDLRLDATSTVLLPFLAPMLTTPQRPLRTAAWQTVMTFHTAIPAGSTGSLFAFKFRGLHQRTATSVTIRKGPESSKGHRH